GARRFARRETFFFVAISPSRSKRVFRSGLDSGPDPFALHLDAGGDPVPVSDVIPSARYRIVLVDRDEDSRRLSELRAGAPHVIAADAALDETLDFAGTDRAAAMLDLTESDGVNLYVA